jgi:hypothetical protein
LRTPASLVPLSHSGLLWCPCAPPGLRTASQTVLKTPPNAGFVSVALRARPRVNRRAGRRRGTPFEGRARCRRSFILGRRSRACRHCRGEARRAASVARPTSTRYGRCGRSDPKSRVRRGKRSRAGRARRTGSARDAASRGWPHGGGAGNRRNRERRDALQRSRARTLGFVRGDFGVCTRGGEARRGPRRSRPRSVRHRIRHRRHSESSGRVGARRCRS